MRHRSTTLKKGGLLAVIPAVVAVGLAVGRSGAATSPVPGATVVVKVGRIALPVNVGSVVGQLGKDPATGRCLLTQPIAASVIVGRGTGTHPSVTVGFDAECRVVVQRIDPDSSEPPPPAGATKGSTTLNPGPAPTFP
jgi:hypothetical protein